MLFPKAEESRLRVSLGTGFCTNRLLSSPVDHAYTMTAATTTMTTMSRAASMVLMPFLSLIERRMFLIVLMSRSLPCYSERELVIARCNNGDGV